MNQGDEVLTLSSCAYHLRDGRLLVIAKEHNGMALLWYLGHTVIMLMANRISSTLDEIRYKSGASVMSTHWLQSLTIKRKKSLAELQY
jgi:hypothetical protein